LREEGNQEDDALEEKSPAVGKKLWLLRIKEKSDTCEESGKNPCYTEKKRFNLAVIECGTSFTWPHSSIEVRVLGKKKINPSSLEKIGGVRSGGGGTTRKKGYVRSKIPFWEGEDKKLNSTPRGRRKSKDHSTGRRRGHPSVLEGG